MSSAVTLTPIHYGPCADCGRVHGSWEPCVREMSDSARAAERMIADGKEIGPLILHELLRETVRCKFGGVRAAARAWGISAATLSLQMRGVNPIGPTILARLGLEKRVSVRYCAPGAKEAPNA